MPAHFFHDRGSGPADRGHAHGAEQIRQQAAEQEADHDIGVVQREVRRNPDEIRVLRGDEVFQVFVIRREQHQRAETGGADRVALGHRLGSIADRVERVGGLAHFLRQTGHFGNAASIVGDRAECVERNDHAGQRQHRGGRDGDAEQAGQRVGDQDAGDDHQGRQSGRFHRNGETLDHVGAMPGHRGFGDRLHRPEIGAGVVFGDPDDQAGDRETRDTAHEQRHAGKGYTAARLVDDVEADHQMGDDGDAHEREHAGGDQPLVQRAHDRLVGAELHEEGSGDRGEDADRADRERIDHHRRQRRLAGEEDRGEHHGGDRGHRIGFEQVGRHAGAVADIVADVIGNGGRVAGIVFRNAGLDLADEIAADIRTLGEDTAAETGEDRDQRSAEAEGDQRVDHDAAVRSQRQRAGQDHVIDSDAEQREARHQHAGDGAGLEGDLKTAGQRLHRGLRGADVGAHRDIHADEAGGAGQDRADGEADRDQPAEQQPDHDEDHDPHHADGGVLAFQISLRALTDGGGDLLHFGRAGIGLHHRHGGPDAIDNGKQTAGDDHPQSCHSNPRLDWNVPDFPKSGCALLMPDVRNRLRPASKSRGHCQKGNCKATGEIADFLGVSGTWHGEGRPRSGGGP